MKMHATALAERAWQAYLKAADLTTVPDEHIFAGLERPTPIEDVNPPSLPLPRITCICRTAEAIAHHSGTWNARCEIEIRSQTDDTEHSEHDERVEEVLSAIYTDTIAADLSAALDDFTAFNVVAGNQTMVIEGRHWVSTIELEVTMIGADIS